jgi:hypothetical protein
VVVAVVVVAAVAVQVVLEQVLDYLFLMVKHLQLL